jgi:D-alanyl-D-alanine carboxypeptidase/D-alanyl-D-alanine-endopeptidase (penicillin-binding protein 4)
MKILLIFLIMPILANAQPLSLSIKKAGYKLSQVSYRIIELTSGKNVEEHNSEVGFTPGSVQKILTSIYAAQNLGLKKKFSTQLMYSGSISNKVLTGNLYLIGKGDPYLQYSDLFDLALKVKALGIEKIRGSLFYDDSHLGSEFIIEKDGLVDEAYNSGISSLSVNFGQTKIWHHNSKFTSLPTMKQFQFSEVAKSFPNGQSLQSSNLKDHWLFSMLKNYKPQQRLPVRNTSLYTASIFKYFLDLVSVKSSSPIKKNFSKVQNLKEISTVESLSLKNLISLNLEYSNNHMAELLLLNTNKKMTKKPFGLLKSAKAMESWFRGRYTTKKSNFSLINGSGLGNNTVSSKLMTDILKDNYAQIWALLPIAGIKGWIEKRFNSPKESFKVWAKTGSLDYASGIAGYLISNKNKLYAFSLFINDNELRAKIFDEDDKISYKFRSMAKAWKKKANRLENTILRTWINKL